MPVMNDYGKLFSGELTNWIIDEAGFNQSKFQMSVYYNYAPDGSKIVLLSYFDDCVYWYTSKELVNRFVYTLGKRFNVKLLGYAHWFVSIRISLLKEHYISVDQARYSKYVVSKYLDTVTIISKFYILTLPHDMIFTKEDASTRDEQVKFLSREFKIHYRACVVSLMYIFYTILYLSFAVHKLVIFHQILAKYTLRVWYICWDILSTTRIFD